MCRRATFVLALLVLQAGLGGAWVILDLGDFPHYGDTREYLLRSKTAKVDVYRGFAYPYLLRAERALGPKPPRGYKFYQKDEAPLPYPSLRSVQILQVLCLVASLLYFVRRGVDLEVLRAPRGRAARLGVLGLLLALVAFDPLVAHHNAALLTDSLALSASLVFCTALRDLGRRETPTWAPALLLVASVFAGSGLRIEKRWVFAVATLATLVLWKLLELAARRETPIALRRGRLAALALVGLGLVLAAAFQASRETRFSPRPPPRIALLDQRILYPHLADVYDALPSSVRAALSREQAERHDRSIMAARKVLSRLKGRERRRVVESAAPVVLRERGPQIALDIAGDAIENVLSTTSFYARLAIRQGIRARWLDRIAMRDEAGAIFDELSRFHPRLSLACVSLSVLLVFPGAALAGLGLWRARRRARRRDVAEALSSWAPVGCFAIANACAFAASADLTSLRYALFAHTVFVVVAYAALLRYALAPRAATPRPSPAPPPLR